MMRYNHKRTLQFNHNYIPTKSTYSNTSVLDLSVTEESNGSLIGFAPELSLSKVERIIESKHRVQLLGENLKIGLGLADGSGSTAGLGRCKGGGRADKGGDDSGFHGVIMCEL